MSTCANILEMSEYHFKVGQHFTTKPDISGESENLIHGIRSGDCQKK